MFFEILFRTSVRHTSDESYTYLSEKVVYESASATVGMDPPSIMHRIIKTL